MKYHIIIFFLLKFTLLDSQEKWVNLIENNLTNWEIKEGDSNFELVDGIIIGYSKIDSPSTYLGTKKMYDDFILEFEVNVSARVFYGTNLYAVRLV